MNNLFNIRKFYQLKHVERNAPVGKRKESPAEHSWSCLILADYFLNKMKKKDGEALDRLKVYELLMYHDVVEIEAGDICISKEEKRKTKEAKFAKAIDALDAEIHELDYKEDWKGWTEEFLRRKKGPLVEEFPELKQAFEEIMQYAKEEGYFDQ